MDDKEKQGWIIAYWPIIVAGLLCAMTYGALATRVSAMETHFTVVQSDHDILIQVKQRLDDIGDRLGVPKRLLGNPDGRL